MKRSRLSLFFGSLLLVFTLAVWVVIYRWAASVPLALSGDPWDYATRLTDLPAGWALGETGIRTPHDLAQGLPASGAALTSTLAGLTQMYYAQYQPPAASEYAGCTSQVVLYPDDTAAAAALAGEDLGAAWESLTAPDLGDGARLWHWISPPGSAPITYRLDFLFRNGLGSVTLMGTDKALGAVAEVEDLARKMQDRMEKNATPPALKALSAAGLPDLRKLLLTQDALAQADPALGANWQIAPDPAPGWLPATSQAPGPAGLVAGYQMALHKLAPQPAEAGDFPLWLYEYVTAYRQPDNAQQALDILNPIERLPELTTPPQIGDGTTRVWQGEVSNGKNSTVAADMIAFRVGSYVASIRLESRPLEPVEISSANLGAGNGLRRISQLSEALAKLLAQNLNSLRR